MAFKILTNRGLLCFITSNKWMSANYGKSLRSYLLRVSNSLLLLDFPNLQIFENAVVFVNIYIGEKSKNTNSLNAAKIEDHFMQIRDFAQYIKSRIIRIDVMEDRPWKIIDNSVEILNRKIENVGTKLKEWDLQFYRGVTTGHNKAFQVNKIVKEELIKNDKNSSQLIKPLLRGKDIKRYRFSFEEIYIIFTRQGISIDNYPIIKNHLFKYYDELRPRNNNEKVGRKPGNYEWYEIQDNTAYYNEFESEKIIWIEISDRANFSYDDRGFYLTNSAYFISGKNLKYLLAILNSKLSDFYFFQISSHIAGNRKRYTKQYVEQIPVPKIEEDKQVAFIQLVNKILASKKSDPSADTSALEAEIDRLVYELYGLTEEEIRIVEGVKV
jgi:hypothetical protein